MSLKQYLLIMAAVTAVAYLMVASVVAYFDPFNSGLLPILFFYASLAIALAGTLTLIGFWLRSMRKHAAIASREMVISLRQAIWFTVLIIAALFLQRSGILTAVHVTLIIAALCALELYFLNKK